MSYTKEQIDAFEHAGEILEKLPRGITITTKAEGRVNSMVIGWGTIGIEWGRPIFIAFVREGRFTRGLLDISGNFTVNVPLDSIDKNIFKVCGTKSGRNIDKVAELGLTLVDSNKIDSPGIAELPLTLECKVIYKQLQDANAIPADIAKENYPQDVDSSNPFANKDHHVAYYGEIVDAYIIRQGA